MKPGWFPDCSYCAYGGKPDATCRARRVKPADSLCWVDNGDWMREAAERHSRSLPTVNAKGGNS